MESVCLLQAASQLTDIFFPYSYLLISVCRAASFARDPVFIYLCSQDDYSNGSGISGFQSLPTVLLLQGEGRAGYSSLAERLLASASSQVFFKCILQTVCISQTASVFTVQPGAELVFPLLFTESCNWTYQPAKMIKSLYHSFGYFFFHFLRNSKALPALSGEVNYRGNSFSPFLPLPFSPQK